MKCQVLFALRAAIYASISRISELQNFSVSGMIAQRLMNLELTLRTTSHGTPYPQSVGISGVIFGGLSLDKAVNGPEYANRDQWAGTWTDDVYGDYTIRQELRGLSR